MNTLIATLLDCPNLSLRVLDHQGRAIKTLNREQLVKYVSLSRPGCTQDCNNNTCEQHPDNQV